MDFEGNKKGLIELLHLVLNKAKVGEDEEPLSKTQLRSKLVSIESLLLLIIESVKSNKLG